MRFCLKDEREIKGEREEERRQRGGDRRRGEGEEKLEGCLEGEAGRRKEEGRDVSLNEHIYSYD